MGAIEGFSTTWSQARGTFGQGVPDDGAQFDQSETLRRLQDDVTSAGPNSNWSGAGSRTYAAANAEHVRAFDGLASADQRLAVEIGNSAAVITAGRRDLETIRRWVADATRRIPDNAAGERALWQVVGKGSGEVADVIARSHGDLSAIAERIRGLGDEYDRLGPPPHDGAAAQFVDFEEQGDGEVPNTTFDLADITRFPPFVPGQAPQGPNYPAYEIGPGTFYPRNDYPGQVVSPPKAPLDFKDIDYRGPGSKAPAPGMMELVRGSGAWVPDPNYPGYQPHAPEIPVDMAEAKVLEREGDPIGQNMIELYPGSLITIPDPDAGRPF